MNLTPARSSPGLLGSAKTTLISPALKEQQGHRIALIGDEFVQPQDRT